MLSFLTILSDIFSIYFNSSRASMIRLFLLITFITGFSPSLLHAQLFPAKQGGKWGYINSSGAVVIQPKFDEAKKFSEGRAAVKLNDAWGFIDTTGNLVIQTQFVNAEPFSHSIAVVQRKNFITGVETHLIRLNGDTLTGETFTDAGSFSEGVAWIKVADRSKVLLRQRFGFIDTTGKIVIPPVLEKASNFSEGLAAVQFNEKFGFIRLTDTLNDSVQTFTIQPKYRYASTFSEGLARVRSEAKWGFINTSGEMVVAEQFDAAGDFSDGLARIRLGEKFGFIDKSGTVVIPTTLDAAGDFSDGLAWAFKNGKYFYIDRTGKTAIDIGLTGVGNFQNGLALVSLGEKQVYINKEGKVIFEFN
jgi:hypothetical protein